MNKFEREVLPALQVGDDDGICQFVQDRFSAFPSESHRLRCLIANGRGGTTGNRRNLLPAVTGVDYVFDAEAEFDVIIAPGFQDLEAFEQFIAQCSNPAAPLLTFSEAFGGRADVVVNELTTAALAPAIFALEPLARRVAMLPHIPTGIDRNGLLALALAYTRNCAIEAEWQPNSPDMVGYSLLLGTGSARPMLEELADAGLLRRRFFERLHVCQRCESSQLHVREVCIACRSSHLYEQPLMHHYTCGFQAPQAAFEHHDNYICPKCHKQLRHYGVDYDKPGFIITCQACGETMTEPEVGFTCVNCGSYTPGDDAGRRDWYHYDLQPDGLAALRSGALPHADLIEGGGRSLRDFRLIVTSSLAVALRYERPLTAWRVTVDTDALAQQVGRSAILEVCQFLRELIIQNTRQSDVVAALPTGVVACLNETDRAGADTALARLRKQIQDDIRPKFDLRVEIFEGERIGALLQDLA